MNLPLQLSVADLKVDLSRLLGLAEGETFPLNLEGDAGVDVLLGGEVIARGVIFEEGESLHLKIVDVYVK